jgi:uncharacterized protein YutE (UPF0331/DUF86 family)
VARPDVAGTRIKRATAWLNDAAARFDRPPDAFLGSAADRDLALFYLFLAIQECLDLAVHWVADAGWGPPEDAFLDAVAGAAGL